MKNRIIIILLTIVLLVGTVFLIIKILRGNHVSKYDGETTTTTISDTTSTVTTEETTTIEVTTTTTTTSKAVTTKKNNNVNTNKPKQVNTNTTDNNQSTEQLYYDFNHPNGLTKSQLPAPLLSISEMTADGTWSIIPDNGQLAMDGGVAWYRNIASYLNENGTISYGVENNPWSSTYNMLDSNYKILGYTFKGYVFVCKNSANYNNYVYRNTRPSNMMGNGSCNRTILEFIWIDEQGHKKITYNPNNIPDSLLV